MCACEPGYLCPKCAGTPDDPRYVELEERVEHALWYLAPEYDDGEAVEE